MKPGLYIVGTPLGNLGDISARALETLRGADLILAEDTRRTRILLDAFEIKTRLESCYQHNERARVPEALAKIKAGGSIAYVSNAGMPGVADPGSLIVSACRRENLCVTALPGPSAVTTAAALSGFGGGGFVFEGFLPRKKGARLRRLAELANESKPVIFFEAPHRCLQFLDEVRRTFGERELFMGRELTKLNEECLWGSASDILRRFASPAPNSPGRAVRGELTFVIAPRHRKAGGGAACPPVAVPPAGAGNGGASEQD